MNTPGRTTGSTTRTNAPSELQPSIIAASGSSRGTSRKNPRISQIANGWLKATMIRMMRMCVS